LFIGAVQQISATVNCLAWTEGTMALKKRMTKDFVSDIIFLDLIWPMMSGQQFLVELKKIQAIQIIPVVVFSTNPTKGPFSS
jgi:CheY-like chemotaxis protein